MIRKVAALLSLAAVGQGCGLKDYQFVDNLTDGGGAALEVVLTSPASTVYTRNTVAVQVSVTGGTPDRVELLRDSDVLTPLSAPYQYTWNTTSVPEGSYQLTARATKGDQVFRSEARTVVVDRTPPTVTTRIPDSSATNVFVDDPISVSFSKPLLPATVTTSSVLLTANGGMVTFTPTLSADGKTVTFAEPSRFAVPATVTATLTSDITDLAGNSLASSSWNWMAPDWVRVGDAVNAFPGVRSLRTAPTLSLDGTGKPVVAFLEFDGTHYNVYVQRWTGSAWTGVGGGVNAFPGARDVQPAPALALDASGNPMVAFWEQDTLPPARFNVYVRRWTGSVWTAVGGAVNAFPGVGDVNGTPALSLDGSGNPIVVFREQDTGTPAHINLYVHQWSGTTWMQLGTRINVFPGVRDVLADAPALSLDGSGRPVVAFREQDTAVPARINAYVQRWTGTAWTAVGVLVNAFQGVRDVFPAAVLTLDASGNPSVAIREQDTAAPARFNVYVQRWTGSAWSPVDGPLNTFPGVRDVLSPPALAMDGTGRPAVSFAESDGTHANLYTWRWTGSSFQAVGSAVNATGRDLSTTDAPGLSLDRTGKPVVAFLESDGTLNNAYVRRSNQ